ncbi:Copia protein [Gossypium australe]|uniref:Copia protein n=1 Tax=Gossypium australe TaxID=47621 RepID=A0A5B6V8X6_9ROSI|nr:Copia protein [Gossypium australe]
MMKDFKMSNLGLMKYFLSFQVKQSSAEIFISQETYVEDLLKKFQMSTCKSVPTPMAHNEKLQEEDGEEMDDEMLYRSLVGSLIYLTNTRPDIVQPVSVLSKFMSKLRRSHYAVAKRVLRSKKQNIVALSSAEAEYAAATSATCEVVWLGRILADL